MRSALAVAAILISCPALAEQLLTGSDVQSQLAGKNFALSCVNGATGRGAYHSGGRVTAAYRLPTARDSADVVQDSGHVRTSGSSLCITWDRLNAGKEGCYRATEREPGRYRIASASGHLWCDFAVQ